VVRKTWKKVHQFRPCNGFYTTWQYQQAAVRSIEQEHIKLLYARGGQTETKSHRFLLCYRKEPHHTHGHI